MKWCKENHTGSLIEVLMKSDLDLRKKKKMRCCNRFLSKGWDITLSTNYIPTK